MVGKKFSVAYGVFSLLLAISVVLGRDVYKYNQVVIDGAGDFFKLLLFVVLLASVVYLVIWGLGKIHAPRKLGESFLFTPFKVKRHWALLLVFSLIIFVCWLPAFLSYFPMVDAYDIFYKTPYWFGQHSQATTGDYINHHSVLHTFFWSLAVKFGNRFNVLPFIPYALGQMLVSSIIYAKVLVFLNKKGVGRIWTILAIVFYALPVNAIFMQVPTKDVSIAPVFTLLILNIYRMVTKDVGYKKAVGIPVAILEGLICCLLRNNFVYAFVVFSIFVFFMQKKVRLRFTVFSISTVLLYLLITGPGFKAMGVYPGEKHEALSLPIQQLSYVMINAPQKLSEENKSEIMMYFPKYDNFNPRFADPVKDNVNDEILESNISNFIKLWLKVGLKCPKEYADAFLTLNIPYWYIGASPLDPYSERIYIETGDEEDHTPVSKALYEFYDKESNFKGINSLAVINILFSLWTPLWLCLFGFFRTISKGERHRATAILLPLLYMLTFLLGPVSCMRYIYPLFAAYPLLFFLLSTGRLLTKE